MHSTPQKNITKLAATINHTAPSITNQHKRCIFNTHHTPTRRLNLTTPPFCMKIEQTTQASKQDKERTRNAGSYMSSCHHCNTGAQCRQGNRRESICAARAISNLRSTNGVTSDPPHILIGATSTLPPFPFQISCTCPKPLYPQHHKPPEDPAIALV